MHELMLIFGATCPICRSHLRRNSTHPSLLLDTAARQAANTLDENATANFRARTTEAEDHARARSVQEFTVGQALDVMDTENIWCAGVVRGVFPNAGHAPTLLVHYLGWDPMYDEYLCARSPRIAPRGFFTQRSGVLTRHPQICNVPTRRQQS